MDETERIAESPQNKIGHGAEGNLEQQGEQRDFQKLKFAFEIYIIDMKPETGNL